MSSNVIEFPGRPRKKIQLNEADFHLGLNDVEDALAQLEHPVVFQRQGEWVEVAVVDSHGHGRRRVNDGSPAIVPVTPDRLRDIVAEYIEILRFNGKRQEWVAGSLPIDYARAVLARKENHLPVLRGLSMTPTLDESGRLVQEPGYDRRSGVYLAIDDDWPVICDEPSQEAAHEALEQLREPVREFPFQDDAALAVWLSAVITGVVRQALRSAPLFGFSAPTSGTGKSLLAEIAGMIVSGVVPAAASQPASEEEAQKVIFSHLASGRPVLNIDNIERALEGDALCSILTQPTYVARVLGTQVNRELSTKTLLLATGNNLAARGDMRTRTLVCHLDAMEEHPESRSFERTDLRAFVLGRRRQLVAAALTILRAYLAAGLPSVNAAPFGRFEQWSQWVRSSLLWLGVADPCATRARVEQLDEKGAQLAALIQAWADAYQERGVTVRDVRADCAASMRSEAFEVLRDAAFAVAGDGDSINARRLGVFVQRNDGRIVEGLRFEKVGTHQGYALWAVRKRW